MKRRSARTEGTIHLGIGLVFPGLRSKLAHIRLVEVSRIVRSVSSKLRAWARAKQVNFT